MRFIWVVFILFLVLISCKAPKEAAPYELKIAYTYLHDTLGGEYEIYIMNLDGSDKKNITNSLRSNDWLYYTYQDRIYFASDRDTTVRMFFLYEMDSEGKNVRKVSDLRLHDSWVSGRNKGKELVVCARVGNDISYQLFLIQTETGAYTQLTHDTAAVFMDPLFSANGQQLFFRHRQHKRNIKKEKAEIWRWDLRDSTMEQLTHYPANDTNHVWYTYHAGPPRLRASETDTLITYQSYQNKRYSIYGIKPTGGPSTKIFEHPKLFAGWHDWSPDGKWLVLDMYDGLQTEFDIYLVNWETREVKQLTDHIDLEQAPRFVQIKK